MRRIAMVSEHASPIAQAGAVDSGGQNIYVAHVARQLAAMGHQVDVFTRLDNAYLPEEMMWDDGVRIVHVPAGPARRLPKEDLLPWMEDFSAFMQQYMDSRDDPYDVIHANFFMSAMAALPVARRSGIPLAVTFHALGRVRRLHQEEADRFPDTRFAIEDDIVHHADRIIAECPQDKRDLITMYGADPERLSMVPCGFDANEMAPMDQAQARALLGWEPDTFYMLQLGRMVPRKGIDNVIVALGKLRARGVNARLCVVGGDTTDLTHSDLPELGRLRALTQSEGLTPYVDFAGRRARHLLRRYYCAADAFVTTPWYEPFGITPVEAMACARPVVGADTGGIRYSVAHGQTGFLVPPKDPEALADALYTLASDPMLAQRMGRAGARRAARLFTWKRVGDELAEIFEELIAPAAASTTVTSKVREARLSA